MSPPVDVSNCDYCGAPIDFYGCPKHGTDCYMDIEQRIAEVLTAHWLEDYARDAAPRYDCSCGQDYEGLNDYNAHVAAVLVSELSLT